MKLHPNPMHWLRLAKTSAKHRHLYRSMLDVAKTILLRGRTARGVTPRRFLKELPVRLKGAPGPIFCRLSTSDFLVFSEIFEAGEYEQVKTWGLAPDSTIIDLGGNIGLATTYFAMLFPKLRSIVVEPDRENCLMIRKNCRWLIDKGQLQVVQAFVAANDGQAGIDRSGRSWSFKKVDEPVGQGETIPCIGMATLLKQSGYEKVDLLKCDIEGSERELFADCGSWIHRIGHLIVETHLPYTPAALYVDLRKAGWNFELMSEDHSQDVHVCSMRHLA